MSKEIVVASSRRPSRRDRQLSTTLRNAQLPAQVAAARIEAAAFTTHVALHHAGMLSATEARLIQQTPLGECRYKAIADAFAGYACHEIALLANQGVGA
jgi:hypothetical protein